MLLTNMIYIYIIISRLYKGVLVMSFYPYLILILGAVSLTLFLVLRDRNGSVEALILKTITSFLFLALAFTSAIINDKADNISYYLLIIMGLICGLIGDIVLDLKIIYKESSSLYQHAGMVSFLIGHIFYLSAIFTYFGFHWLPLVIALAAAVAINLVSKFVLKYNFKEHTIDCYLYAFFLSYMSTQSIYAAINAGGSATTILLAIGAALFMLSDLVLLKTYYEGKASRPYIIVNHTLYYGAQFLIALSILFI
jgi:uncharacterized membrane protein YhhN